ncbi:MAG: hypothetical protein ACXWX5_02175 [Actinomycetota bacterium]
MAKGSDAGRCPTCGAGTLVDVSFDLDTADPLADGMQEAESRQVETFSCGHTDVGPRLSSADQEAMTVERRTSDETTMPAADLSQRSPDGVPVPAPPEEQEDLVDEASEESFPASDPPSYWARETPDTT